jgi:hypothetical protein
MDEATRDGITFSDDGPQIFQRVRRRRPAPVHPLLAMATGVASIPKLRDASQQVP